MTQGIVAAGTSHAAKAGAELLRKGGNAVDAAVAAALAMGVADPANTSIGGRCHVLIRFPDGRVVAMDGRTALPQHPNFAPPDTTPLGAFVVPVPGNPTCYAEAVRRFGACTWEAVVTPAVSIARSGFEVPARLGAAWKAAAPGLRTDAATARLFLREGQTAPAVGDVFKQPLLAGTLEDLALRGPDAIMAGPRAERIVAQLRAAGSGITERDFGSYQPLESEVVQLDYRGWQVSTIGRQGYGYTMLEALGILSHFEIGAMDCEQRWTTILLAQALARRDRPRTEAEPAAFLLDPAHLARRAEALAGMVAEAPFAVRDFLGTPPARAAEKRGNTTHISAVDASGLSVGITTSIGPHFGALLAEPADGFLFGYSYRLAERDRHALRDRTEMLPTILAHPDGRRVVLGAGGSSRIPGAVLRTIIAIVDLGMSAEQAVLAPALVWHEGWVESDPSVAPEISGAVERMGLPVFRMPVGSNQHYGLLHVAAVGRMGDFTGGADRYWDGAAVQA